MVLYTYIHSYMLYRLHFVMFPIFAKLFILLAEIKRNDGDIKLSVAGYQITIY